MQNIGLFEKLIDFTVHKGLLTFIVFLVLTSTQTKISSDQNEVLKSSVFKIEFSHFSPAFAAFEDDFLFSDTKETYNLKAGTSSKVFKSLTTEDISTTTTKLSVVASVKKKAVRENSKYLNMFDGDESVTSFQKHKVSKTRSLSQKKLHSKKQAQPPQNEELRFGSLVAMVNRTPVPAFSPAINHGAKGSGNHSVTTQNPDNKDDIVDPNHLPDKKPPVKVFSLYNISGSIELKQGLAFLGSMEISWVAGDYELQIGSINTPDATFEIEVSKLVGDIVLSLYDNNDELIGEGFIDLTRADSPDGSIKSNIEVYPIDWDYAGQIIHGDSLGSGVSKPVEGVEVALYAFNDATQSSSDGSIHFYNWKKTNSRTLAIASKEGFKDSIFMMDSKTPAEVILFSEKYINSFFNYLKNIGIHEAEDKGLIYGRVTGVTDRSGYSVRVEKEKPIYFMNAGFASTDQESTANNGLFSFVGLQDGDYELYIEKEGEVVDHRVVAVEQGKVSPVLVNLKNISKHIEFYDPMMPERQIEQVEINFFDGANTQDLEADSENSLKINISSGYDPSLIEFATPTEVNRTFISRNKNLQRVPLLNDSNLQRLAEKSNFKINDGLIFGFVETDDFFTVDMVENAVDKIIYFNKDGEAVDPEHEVAHGFILAGFQEGLSSIVIERVDDSVILATDLVFSNHESISVSYLKILDTN